MARAGDLQRRLTAGIAAVVLAGTGVIAGCGDDDADDAETSPGTATDEPDTPFDAGIDEVLSSAAADEVLVSSITSGGVEGIRIVDLVVYGDRRAFAQDEVDLAYRATTLDDAQVRDLLSALVDAQVGELDGERLGDDDIVDGFETRITAATPDGTVTVSVLDGADDRRIGAVREAVGRVHEMVIEGGDEVSDLSDVPGEVSG